MKKLDILDFNMLAIIAFCLMAIIVLILAKFF